MKSSRTLLAAAATKRESFRSRMPQSSYYKNNRPTAALERARSQYLVPNIITGIVIFSFAIGVYAFTIKAVSQDEFEDVPVPNKAREADDGGAMANEAIPHAGTGGLGAVGVQGVSPQGGVPATRQ